LTLKQFKFSDKEDFIYYLRELILLVHKNVVKYEEQVQELELYIEEHKLIERPNRVISPKVYADFRGRLLFISNYLLNAFGDQADLGISYQNYRKAARKQNIKLLDLSDEEQAELNSLTTSRDWSAHIPASILHSSEERAKNLRQKGPITYPEFKKFQGIWLVSLYEESYKSLQGFKKWKGILMNEYTSLTDEPCMIVPFSIDVREISDLEIPEISWLIQTKKIKSISEIKEYYESKNQT
jgi:hypothetical protein